MSVRSTYPYIQSYIKSARFDAKPVRLTGIDAGPISPEDTRGLFKYDPLSFPLRNTQQLNLDWSRFENHTFFSSAEVKVNEAFNAIINGYPFDGTKLEVEQFLDKLSGFDKYVYDNFPRWKGALAFSGTAAGEDPASGYAAGLGNWISVKDSAGFLYPDLAKNSSGDSILNPDADTSFTIEAQVFLPQISNGTQVIFQKSSTQKEGLSVHLQPSSSDDVTAVFSVSSGSFQNSVSANLKKGEYNHICVSLNKSDAREHVLQFFVNENLVATSKNSIEFGKLNIDTAEFLIGSGTAFFSNKTLVTPTQTFSGTLDELRVFHSLRDAKTQKLYAAKGLYSTPDLKLYYRFNEPQGKLSSDPNDDVNRIVLDSSGNALHSVVNNFTSSLRIDASKDVLNPVTHEREEFTVILFPAYTDVLDLNATLLTSASTYDRSNPNLIINLVPKHYLLEGAFQDGTNTELGNYGAAYSGDGIPGQGVKGTGQIILSFLYIWAKFFDDIKMYVDSFSTLRTVDYETNETIPDNFLDDLIRESGFYLPPFFAHASVAQYIEGEDYAGVDYATTPLKKIHSALLRRVLVNLPDVVRSKGTQHSIRSFLRSVGIDPDNSLKIREYGGPTVKQLSTARSKKMVTDAMLDFVTSSVAISNPLSASRVEPGFPRPTGNFLYRNGNIVGTSDASDGLLTSGSWALEGVFRIPPQKTFQITDVNNYQSLMRMIVTGSTVASSPGLVANIIATPRIEFGATPARVLAYLRPGTATNSPLLKMSLDMEGSGLFGGDKWYVSIGCQRNDASQSVVSSSYFLRVASLDNTIQNKLYQTSSFFLENPLGEDNVFRKSSTTHNASGSYVVLGKNQTVPGGLSVSGYKFLNDYDSVPDTARVRDFIGRASNIKFWSKHLEDSEWKEHAKNYRSTGVDNPLTNYSFVNVKSGSFEKLRMNAISKQEVLSADASGRIELVDYSLNNNFIHASGYDSGSNVLMGEQFIFTQLSTTFDEISSDDKVRIRSFLSLDDDILSENPWSVPAPSYYHSLQMKTQVPQDDTRLSIEFSLIDSLNNDIINMFSTFDSLASAIGNPELAFSPDYPALETMRDIYFNRLSDRVYFKKFLEFYRWFDISISTFIEQLMPAKTKYKGTNFVIESHMLERHKKQYFHNEMYMGDKMIVNNDNILLQQVQTTLKKY